MSIRYLDQDYISLKEFIERKSKGEMRGTTFATVYAHPMDAWILKTLNATPVKAIMNKAIDSVVSFEFGHTLVQGISIDQKSFPDLFDVLCHCSRTLGITTPHAVAQHDATELFNAYTVGTDEYSFINISSALCQFFPKNEACFVIGHECGHIASGHMVYHTLGTVLTEHMLGGFGPVVELARTVAGLPLTAWSRRSEITCDRAGLLCCGDIKIAERALLRLTAGLADIAHIDIDDYLRKSRETEGFHTQSTKFHELFASHPLIPKRIEALRLFADSALYYSLSKKPRPAGKAFLSQEELNQRVNQIVRP